MNIRISVAIIVRNEEDCIKRCLISIIGKFDEYVIIDSGSHDKTQSLIMHEFESSKAPYRLIATTWNDDFSVPRNLAISNATGDAIFFIDADEVLLSDRNTLRHAFENIDPCCSAICPSIKNHDGQLIKDIPRGFFLKEGFYYYGFVHEELRGEYKNIVKISASRVLLYHDGYMDNVVKLKDKIHRNIDLNKKNIDSEPGNVRWVYFYCRDAIGFVDNNILYNLALDILLINKELLISKENISYTEYTPALLDVMTMIQLEIICHTDEVPDSHFLALIEIMEYLRVNSGNIFFYKKIHDLFMWNKKAKQNLLEIIHHIKERDIDYQSSLHSEGYHIDQLLAIYLYENKMFNESYKTIELISNANYSTNILKKYKEYFKGYKVDE